MCYLGSQKKNQYESRALKSTQKNSLKKESDKLFFLSRQSMFYINNIGSRLTLEALPLLNGEVLNPQELKGQWLVLGISIDKQLQNTKTHFQKHGYNFDRVWLNPELKTVIYKARSLPTTLIFNPQEKLL